MTNNLKYNWRYEREVNAKQNDRFPEMLFTSITEIYAFDNNNYFIQNMGYYLCPSTHEYRQYTQSITEYLSTCCSKKYIYTK